ncbi:MAG: ABC transporter substrate-binding protein, partial [Pseudomonadota bacterium]
DDKIAFAIGKMLSEGIVVSGDAETMGIGVMTDAKVGDFYQKMIAAGVIEEMDWKASYTTDFVGKGVGLDLAK